MKLRLDLITPEKIVLQEEVDSITLPTANGELTILPEHENLVSQVGTGEMHYVKSGKDYLYALTGGFLEINGSNVNVMAQHAIKAEDIQLAKAKEAKEKAEKLMKEKLSEHDMKVAEGELRKALLELKVGVKYKSR